MEGSSRAERCGLCTMAAAEGAPAVHAVKKAKAWAWGSGEEGHLTYHDHLACSFPEAYERLFPGPGGWLGSVRSEAANDDNITRPWSTGTQVNVYWPVCMVWGR